MEREPGIKWLFFDLNSYFASVEQQERPELRGKPVAIVPMPTDATCAIAASYEAKAYGVKTGTKIYEARKMCPGLRCVLARHDVYVSYHHRILEEVIKHTPINKVCSIDELSSRLPPGKRSVEASMLVAQRIKTGLRERIGAYVRCSIGIAPNSFLAKVATDMEKPDGLVVLTQESLPGRLLELRLSDLPGIGVNMERRLIRAGVTSVEALWHISPKQARRIWGSVQGERFWYWLHGYDFESPETGNVMIGHSRMLDPDLRPAPKAREMARRLLVKATYRLRRKGFYARKVSLSVRSIDGGRWGGELKVLPAREPFTFLAALEELWEQMLCAWECESFLAQNRLRLKKVSVVLHGLCREGEISGDLFEEHVQTDWLDKVARHESLTAAMEKLQEKYKKEMVSLGVPPKTLAGHVGTKIAFSRVPDQQEFWG